LSARLAQGYGLIEAPLVHLLLGLLFAFLAFAIVGFGPALYLNSAGHRLGVAIAVAPVVGFVLITVFGTYLTLLNITVARWTIPLLIVGTAASFLLTLLACRTWKFSATPQERHSAPWAATGFALTWVLLVAPQLLGGLQYSVLRGNGTDAFNYVAAADYLDREPLSWAKQVDPQTLVNRDDSYARASTLLDSRWSTFMLLAFSSRLAQVPPYIFEYCFSLLCFLLAYGPAYLYSRDIGLEPGYAALTAAVICLGFWAQLILDTRAQSQLNSIPVLLLLMLLISRFEDPLAAPASGLVYAPAGLTAVSLAFLYPELVPLLAVALFLFFITRLRALDFSFTAIRRYIVAGGVMILAGLPMWGLLARFARSQISYAAVQKNTWHVAYYSWLYSNPLAGFWGFGPLESSGTIATMLTSAAVTFLGFALTILLVLAWIQALRSRQTAFYLASCTSLAALTEFGYLAARGQLWAAAKGLSFGYAFFTLCVAGYCLRGSKPLAGFWRRPGRAIAACCALTFMVSQAALGIARPAMAVWKRDYPHYIVHHGEYRRHIWDISEFQKILAGRQGVTVWSDVSNPWISEYLDFALGGQVKFINIGADLDVLQLHARPQERSQLPQYIIADNAMLGSTTRGAATGIVARTPELALIRTNSVGATLVSVSNPNGLEKGADGRTFFWMGNMPTIFTVMSSTNGCAQLSGSAILGPSSDLPYRTLSVGGVSTSDPGASITLREGEFHWPVRLRAGFNEVTVAIKESPTRHLPTDSRPLLLRVDNLRLEDEKCEAQSR
jgi:hypothetical protein